MRCNMNVLKQILIRHVSASLRRVDVFEAEGALCLPPSVEIP